MTPSSMTYFSKSESKNNHLDGESGQRHLDVLPFHEDLAAEGPKDALGLNEVDEPVAHFG